MPWWCGNEDDIDDDDDDDHHHHHLDDDDDDDEDLDDDDDDDDGSDVEDADDARCQPWIWSGAIIRVTTLGQKIKVKVLIVINKPRHRCCILRTECDTYSTIRPTSDVL